MGASVMNDFKLESEGHCFFCLQQIPVKVKNEPELLTSPQPQSKSVHYLARYLEVDMGKVLIEEGQRDSVLLTKLRKSRLKVELCEKCTSLNKTFSRLYRQLEKLEIEIKSSLGLIHEELIGGDRRDKHDNNLAKFRFHSAMRGELSQIEEVLRQETIQKCFRKMGVSSPRVGLEKLTKKKIDAELSKHQTVHKIREIDSETSSSQKIIKLQENVKTEFESPNENFLSDDYDDSRNYEMDSEAKDDDEPPDTTNGPRLKECDQNLETEMDVIDKNSLVIISTPFMSTNKVGKEKYTMNPETRKWKCNTCPLELTSRTGILHHNRSVHQKIRYRCVPCGKEFVHKHVYDRHHQGVHVGVRFKCLVCNKLFSQKDNLLTHQRRKTCGEGGS